MSPLTANVILDGVQTTISACVCKPDELSGSRYIKIKISQEWCIPFMLTKYIVNKSIVGYTLIRYEQGEAVCVGKPVSLLDCQKLALTDYCELNNIKVIE